MLFGMVIYLDMQNRKWENRWMLCNDEKISILRDALQNNTDAVREIRLLLTKDPLLTQKEN